jgi:hypothetical protein
MKLPLLPGQKYAYVFEIRPRRRWGWQLLGRAKSGFSTDADRRTAEVERSIKEVKGYDVEVSLFAAVPVYWHRQIEYVMQKTAPIKWLRTKEFEPANGGTECFKVFNWLCGLVVYTACWWWGFKDAGLVFGLFVMLQPRPLDMATYLWVLYAVQLVFIFIIAGAVIWLLWCLGIAAFAA